MNRYLTRRDALRRIICTALAPSVWVIGSSGSCANPTTLTPYDFGAAGDGVADDTHALRQALLSAVSQRKVLDLLNGTYRVTGSCVAEGDLRLINSGGAVIHAAAGDYSDIGVLVVRGTAVKTATLSAPVFRGMLHLPTATSTGFAPGDLGTIFNPAGGSFSRFRTYYRAGEFFEVSAVAGKVIELQRPLYSSYRDMAVEIYRINPVSGYLRDIVITSEGGPSSLIYIDYARGFELNNPKLRHANNDCIFFNRSFDCRVFSPDVANAGDGGDDYGIVWSNCQNCQTSGGTIYARRHAVAHGGSDQVNGVPCRDIVTTGQATLRNDPASGTHCADFHGNTEDCTIENCTVFGGVGIGGKNNRVLGNVVHSMANGVAVLGFEVIGGRYEMRSNTFRIGADPQAATRGVIDFGGNSVSINGDTTEDLTITVENSEFVSAKFSSDTRLLNVRNRGAKVKVNVKFASNKLDINDFGMAVYMDVIPATGGVAASDSIVIEKNETRLTGRRMLHQDGAYSALPVLRVFQART